MKAKKVLALLLALAMVAVMFAACGTKEGDTTKPSDGDSSKKLKVGVIQLIQHDALDAACKGFIDGLNELGYVEGDNLTVDVQNAQGETANCTTIAEKFVNDGVDLILAIATDSAQAAANATSEIPILVTAVTDPESAGVVATNEAPGGNVSGTSDMNPIEQQAKLLNELVPDAKTVGMLYASSEDNSKLQSQLASDALKAYGIESSDYSVSDLNDVQSVVDSMVGKVDAVYIPTDNMMANAMVTVSSILNAAGIPSIVGEGGMVENGGMASYGLDYYALGKQTAAMAAKIFKGEATPATMPIEYLQDAELFLNKTAAAACGVTFTDEQIAEAGEKIYE